MAKKSNNPLTNAKRLLQHLQEKALTDSTVEFKEIRTLAEAWMKLDMLQKKFKVDEDDSGLSDLQNRLRMGAQDGENQ